MSPIPFEQRLKFFRDAQQAFPEADRAAHNPKEFCDAAGPDGNHCTKPSKHFGEHIAHAILGNVICRWPNTDIVDHPQPL